MADNQHVPPTAEDLERLEELERSRDRYAALVGKLYEMRDKQPSKVSPGYWAGVVVGRNDVIKELLAFVEQQGKTR